MPKPYLIPFIFIFVKSQLTYAFDPFTALTVANQVSGILNSSQSIASSSDLGGFSDFLGLASDTLSESSDLSNELGYASNSVELDQKLSRLEELNSKLRDVKWFNEELKYNLNDDINNTKNLSQKIKNIRKILSISKKLAGTFGLKTKGSEKVAALEQVKINSLILDELQSMHKMQLLSYLDNKEQNTKQSIYLNKIILEENKKNSFRSESQ